MQTGSAVIIKLIKGKDIPLIVSEKLLLLVILSRKPDYMQLRADYMKLVLMAKKPENFAWHLASQIIKNVYNIKPLMLQTYSITEKMNGQ